MNATGRMVHYRENAKKQGKAHLFVETKGKPPETSVITSHLRRLTKRLGIRERITSHSARKGVAVEALKAGVPLSIIQALDAWKDPNSMQAYIWEAVRRSVSLIELLEEAQGGREKARQMQGQKDESKGEIESTSTRN